MRRILAAGLPPDLTSWLEHRMDVPVRATRDGEETLTELARDEWSLLIIDDRLTNPSAFDVLGRVRQSLGLAHLPVIYCLQQGPRSDLAAHLVGQFGVGQLLFHPLDREELARQAAACMGIPLPTETVDQTQTQRQTSVALAQVWEKFKDTIIGRVAVLEQATLALLEDNLDSELHQRAIGEAHKLAGSLGTFGFPKGSQMARQVEELYRAGDALGQVEALRLSEMIVALRRELQQPAGAQAAPAPTTPAAADDDQPLLLIVDDDEALGELLMTEAAAWGMRAQVAPNVAAARERFAVERPAAVLLDLSFPDGTESALAFLGELSARTPRVPVLVLTGRDAFTHRVEVARLGGRGFLQKPVPTAQVMEAVTQLLQRERASDAKVLIVDDDPHVLATVRMLLEPRRIRLITLEDPLRFWDVLEETSPDLVMLDVELPHVSGIELCRVVRNDPRWAELPVLFLTAYTDRDVVRRVFAAGADDYVSKPIVGPELVTRIANRLDRTQLYRSLAETDTLTGVANRRKSGQVLGQFLRLAERHGQPLSLAILDLDHFKQVNDNYGHAAGDAVLGRLGQLLLRSFRGEDVVARWGGEEFMVGMYGMTKRDGVQRLAEVLDILRREDFALSGGAFHVSFSAGVAEYPTDGHEVQALYRAADGALYQAKEAGRNRVLATEDHVPAPDDQTLLITAASAPRLIAEP